MLCVCPETILGLSDLYWEVTICTVQFVMINLFYFLLQKKTTGGDLCKNLIGYVRKLTGCNPLAQSLYQLLQRNEMISRSQKVHTLLRTFIKTGQHER